MPVFLLSKRDTVDLLDINSYGRCFSLREMNIQYYL